MYIKSKIHNLMHQQFLICAQFHPLEHRVLDLVVKNAFLVDVQNYFTWRLNFQLRKSNFIKYGIFQAFFCGRPIMRVKLQKRHNNLQKIGVQFGQFFLVFRYLDAFLYIVEIFEDFFILYEIQVILILMADFLQNFDNLVIAAYHYLALFLFLRWVFIIKLVAWRQRKTRSALKQYFCMIFLGVILVM